MSAKKKGAQKRGHSSFSNSKKRNVPFLQNGFVLMPVVLALVVVATLALMLNRESASDVALVRGQAEHDTLRYVTEAGLAHAQWELSQNAKCTGYTDVPNTSFNNDSYSVTVSPTDESPITLSATGTLANGVTHKLIRDAVKVYDLAAPITLTLQPDGEGKDTFIEGESGHTGHNKGDNGELKTSSLIGKEYRTLLQFDLSALPATARIESATLELDLQSFGSTDVVEAHRVLRAWTETGASWNDYDGSNPWSTPGGDYDPDVAGSFLADGIGPKSMDITAVTQAWANGYEPNYGLILLSPPNAGGNQNIYHSSDKNGQPHPKLTLTYFCECGTVCAINANAPYAHWKLDDGAGPTAVDSVGGHDGTLVSNPAWVAGQLGDALDFDGMNDYVDVGTFDVSGSGITLMTWFNAETIPTSDGRFISKADGPNATDAWWQLSTTDSGSNRYLRMRIKAGGTTTTFADSSVNLTTGQWYFAVGTYDATSGDMKLYLDGAEVASAPHAVGGPVDAGPTVPVAIGANGTVERFFDGLLDDVRVYDRALSATEISDLFAAASAGGSKLLFVVGNVSSPGMTSEELAHQTLIESWGYTVELIDDDASQADFDNAVANNDVVFTTNDITASRLNTKLVNATIGVVTSEDNLSDEFGLSSSIAWESGSVVEINDNSHYITSPFPLGVLTILSGSESLAYVTGTLSPDLGQLASSSSGYGVVTLDAGASMYGGGPAAGRRVQLPWGGNGFDPNNLTTDGSTILQRALEWGAGAGAAAMGPIAHWKLDDGTGLTAVDSEGGHDGTLTSGPAWVAGQLGDALDFDGADDYVDLTSDAELDDVFVGGATAMAWIEPASWGNNGYGRIFDKSTSPSATGDGWAIRLNKDNGGLNFGQGFTGGRGWWRFAESSINFNTWHHVALAYDASSTANDPTVYLDGSPVAVTRVDTPSGDIRSDASINLHLGNHASSAATFFDGKIDDARIYDRILDATEIADIAAGGGGGGGGGGGPGYNETYAPWSAPNNDTWEAVDLGAFGVPANAVVEVAVVNSSTNTHLWGGVRAVGSTLNRRLQLHEAESGGTDVMVMTVQADASSRIEHYSDSGSNPTFILLGYWGSGTFVEAWDFFNAGASSSWRDHALATYGVSPGHVAEILVHNDTTNNEYQGGVRTNGSTASRRFDIHEPEGGGKDMITMLVNAGTDDGATIEVAAESDSGIDFYLMGHWSTPPGVYTEAFAALSGSPTSSGAWDDKDLTSLGVPASAVAQIVLANGQDSAEAELGIRGKGSSLDRTFDLQEAESGGDDLASMHVNTDGSSTIQWYDQNTGQDHRFYVLGWWVLSP